MIIGRFYKRYSGQIGYVTHKKFDEEENQYLYFMTITDVNNDIKNTSGPPYKGEWSVYEENAHRWKLIKNDKQYKLELL